MTPERTSVAAPARRRAADRIRETARDLFYRQGIRAVGIDAIVAQAGVTKPSLYRAFASKDDLCAAYLSQYGLDFFERFEMAVAAHAGDPRAQIRAWMTGLAERATSPGYRGCGITNAVVEFPDSGHPARAVAEAHKRELRARLAAMAAEMGVAEPQALGDGLLLLMEGAYATGQLFGEGGPAGHVADAAEAMIEAHLIRAALKRAPPRPR